MRQLDPTRPIHYEGFGIGKGNPADMDSNMYPSLARAEEVAKSAAFSKPYYLCEYAHAMFNSMGSLADYNDLIDKYPAFMGGAIWEWEDQGLWDRRDPKRPFLAYGGSFGDVPNDRYYIHKGVVFSDRSPKPHYSEVKRAYQWVGFVPDELSAGRIKIKNKYAFTDLAQFSGTWTVTEDGVPIQKGPLSLSGLAPGKEKVVTLPIAHIMPQPGARYFLNLAVALTKDESWAKAGYEVANMQFELPVSAPPRIAAPAEMKPLQLRNDRDKILVAGRGFSVAFGRGTGTISEFSREDVNVLLPGGGPVLNLWRAPHQIDDTYASKKWDEAGLNRLASKVISVDAKQIALGLVCVSTVVQYTGQGGFVVTHSARFTVAGDESIAVDNSMTPQGLAVDLARIGVRLLLDRRLDALDYLARGPMENYADRKHGSDMGLYSSTVEQQLTPYAKPMEAGNHEDMRWAALKGAGMPTLLVQAEDAPMQFSALPYTDQELDKARYPIDLPASTATVFCLSSQTLGVGSFGCGPPPLPQYRVPSKPA